MAAGIVAAIALVAVLLAIMGPVPPKTITMAVGPEGDAYHQIGKRYRELLARNGVELRLVPTNGSVDSLQRLNDPGSGVSVAFLQGGMTTARDSPDLVSLGTMFYEPVWIFYRGEHARRSRDTLIGKRVSIGPEGSGTRALAMDLIDVVLQPHVSSGTHWTRAAMGQLVVDNLAAFFAGKPLLTQV